MIMNRVAVVALLVCFSVNAQTSEALGPPPIVAAEPKVLSSGRDGSPEAFEYTTPIPKGFHLVRGLNWRLLVAGIGVFALGYLPFALVGAVAQARVMAIPFVGPVLSFKPSAGFAGGATDFVAVSLIVLDTVAQLGGASLAIVGAVLRLKWLERDPATPSIVLAPGAPGTLMGASLVGRF
jgi:hypothetical protein